jgi:hypothetical protein
MAGQIRADGGQQAESDGGQQGQAVNAVQLSATLYWHWLRFDKGCCLRGQI